MARREESAVNYPDILGAITGGVRFNADVVQCALAVRPAQVSAGAFFETILLVQNASDIDVDVVVNPVLPERDAGNGRGRFMTKSSRLRIGLRPAEVGFVSLPISTSPKTVLGADYQIGMDISIKRVGKRPQRVRDVNGGGGFLIQELPAETQRYVTELRQSGFSVDTGGRKNHLCARLEMLAPTISDLKELKPSWISLWTIRDYMDEYSIAEKIWDKLQLALGQMDRERVFMPLLKATQDHFQACHYPLHPPEAIYVTKLLTLILEYGIVEPTPDEPNPPWPDWFVQTCRLMFQEPVLANQIEHLVGNLVYSDLVYDAILQGFMMVSTVTNEEFGTEEETAAFAEDIRTALNAQRPLDFSRAYFPLILGGLVVNTRVTMPREQVRETVFILSKALKKRYNEKNADNTFIFDMAEKLIERALDIT
ncbi:MAG: hypothetical protein JW966_16025 [Anaerolineae bacterium]|nr:hypothetical protein [Anaerolineae bacterium]